MPLLPSHTLLQTYSLTLVLSSYLLISSPLTLLNATPLWLLGESMHIKPAAFTPSPSQSQFSKLTNNTSTNILSPSTSELLSLLAFILLLAAISQSILASPLRYSTSHLTHLASKSTSSSSSSPSGYNDKQTQDSKSAFAEQLYNLHRTQTVFLTLSAVRVLLEGALTAYIYLFFSTRTSTSRTNNEGGVFALLANRVVFTVAMGDMLFWGYMWTVLRDEAREVAGLVEKRRKMEEEVEMEMKQ